MKKISIYTLILLLAGSLSLRAESYTLHSFLDHVEQYSNELKLAHKQVDLAAAQKKEAVAGALPSVTANASYDRHLSDTYMYVDMSALTGGEGSAQKLKINRNNNYALSVGLSQTIFSLNVHNAIKASRQYQKLTDYSYDASHLEIMTYAKKGFYSTLLLKTVWEVSQASMENAHENYLDVKQKYENGLVSEFDLLQAEVRWKDMISQTSEAKKNYDLALISLKNLAGIPAGDEISLEGSLDQYPEMPPDMDFESILQSRPDYNALIWEEKLRSTNISSERSGYFPSLTGSFTYSFSSQSDEWSFDEKNDSWILGLNLSVPLFKGGATRARVQKARIEYDQTAIRIDRTVDDIYKEIESVRLRLDESSSRINSARATLNTAEKAFHIAEASSQNGLATQLELKDARLVLDQANVNYYAAIYAFLEALFDWEQTTGGVYRAFPNN